MSESKSDPSEHHLAGSAYVDDLVDLAAAARAGNRRAVRTLITAVGPAMLRAIRQVMGTNHADLEDLLQEASLNLLEGLNRFSGSCWQPMRARRRLLRRINKKKSELQPGLDESEGQATPRPGSSTSLPRIADRVEAATEAAKLYAEANRARRAGDTTSAVELYRKLVATWPAAKEAEQSRSAEAELLLQQGDPDGALQAFRGSQASATTAVSLWGAARALRALHRVEEEREVLLQLSERFPESAYSVAARQRLGQQP